ncbi:NUAK SNF1-like kinase 1 [Tulasnella sp. 418]|nr:NUAK SNF1-like kinase 1 [Tulasnella sp. 418]
MSLHSLKMLRHYTGRNDHVILTVYVSYARCLLHLLFYDDKKPGYVQLCVFDGNNIFVPERLSLLAEFIRRILNFARFCHPGGPTSLSDPEYKHQIQLVKQLSVDLPSKNSKTSHHSRGQGQSDRSKYKAREQDMIPLTQMGYYITRIPHEMYKSDRVVLLRKSKSDQVLVAKRTTAVEVQFIKSLLSARSHKYENHTIPYKHVIQSNTAHPYLVMPYYSDLSSLRSLSPQLYPHLRLQLIEGVAFMHEQGVVHRDLKPSNIVLDFKEYRIFIIDYDLSRHQSPGEQSSGYCGTEGWTAPEIQDNAFWDPRSADIWALANVLRYLSKRTGCPDLDIERVLTLGPAERPSAERLLESFRTSLKRGLPLHDGLPFPKRPHTITNLGVEDSILSCCTDVGEMDS